MSDATVLRESTNDGYYMVLPSIGKGEVEAIDMQRAGFSTKAKATIIQIGSKYGIVSKLKGLTGVLAVPADSRVAVALKNPAQFALAYFATLLGNIKRAYAVAEVLSVGAKTMLLKYTGGIDSGKQFYAAPMAGLVLGDFGAEDVVVVSKLQVAKPAVCGWWESYRASATLVTAFCQFICDIRDYNGDIIAVEENAPLVKVSYGRLDVTGETTGIKGGYIPFGNVIDGIVTDSAGRIDIAPFLYSGVENFSDAIYAPGKIKIEYFYDGRNYSKVFDINGVLTTDEGSFSFNYGAESGIIQSILLGSFETSDFQVEMQSMIQTPAGSISAPIPESFGIEMFLTSGIYDLDDGTMSINGEYSEGATSASWYATGSTMKSLPRLDETVLGVLPTFRLSLSGTFTACESGIGCRSMTVSTGRGFIIPFLILTAKPYVPQVIT